LETAGKTDGMEKKRKKNNGKEGKVWMKREVESEGVNFILHTYTRTNLVFALLFCQPVSFLDIEYHMQSHFSSYHVLLLSSIFLAMSFLL